MAMGINTDEITELMKKFKYLNSNKKGSVLCVYQNFTYKHNYPKGDIDKNFSTNIF